MFKLSEAPIPGTQYRVIASKALMSTTGVELAPAGYSWTFSVEDEPALVLTSTDPAANATRVPLDLGQITLQFNNPVTVASLANVRLEGPGVKGLIAQVHGTTASFKIDGQLQSDQPYSVMIPTSVTSVAGHGLGTEGRIQFMAAGPACPPNVYADSFAGMGIGHDDGINVDLQNAEQPHSGKFAIKISTGDKEGTVYFFAGRSDHGDERKPIDLTGYDRLEFFVKGDAPDLWVKIGHPAFDKAFHQEQIHKVSPKYSKYTISVPQPSNQIGTLFVISVPAHKTVYLDDLRFLKATATAKDEMEDLK
jgi:hypothetical protein